MKINFDRMAKLAGIENESYSRRSLNESAGPGKMPTHESDIPAQELEEGEDDLESADEGMHAEPDMNEMIEVDEVMLVQELRRAKAIMAESRKNSRKQRLQEAKLQKIIEEEVQNIFGDLDLNLNSDWVYGGQKPRRSKRGYTHQGSYLKGIGFK